MDDQTRKARELVTVELRQHDHRAVWSGLGFTRDLTQALPMERGRAEILVAQQRRQIGIDRCPGATVTIVELEQPAPRLTARQVAREIKRLLPDATIAMQPIRWREEDR